MPDIRPRNDIPAGWPEAFAALPLETSPADGWRRVAARLPSPRRARTRWQGRLPYWAASAAVLAVVAVVPLKLLQTESPVPARDVSAAAATSVASTDVVPEAEMTSTEQAPSAAAEDTDAAQVAAATVVQEGPIQAAPAAVSSESADDAPADRIAAAGNADAIGTAQATPADAAPPGDATLERLYAESAQLEALLALARDDRVATGTADTLASGYDAQVASIDAALVQPGIDDAARASLWQDRVDVLRQAATFESTRRMLAAQGERYDAMLVSID